MYTHYIIIIYFSTRQGCDHARDSSSSITLLTPGSTFEIKKNNVYKTGKKMEKNGVVKY